MISCHTRFFTQSTSIFSTNVSRETFVCDRLKTEGLKRSQADILDRFITISGLRFNNSSNSNSSFATAITSSKTVA